MQIEYPRAAPGRPSLLPQAVTLWKTAKLEFAVWLCSFLSTLLIGLQFGLGVAIALALCIVLYYSSLPHTSILGQLPEPEDKIFR